MVWQGTSRDVGGYEDVQVVGKAVDDRDFRLESG